MVQLAYRWGAPVRPYIAPVVTCRVAAAPWEHDEYWRLRREVFVEEQRLFAETDQDSHDDHALPIVAVTELLGMADEVVGAVRIYPISGEGDCITGARVWFGGRLAVASAYRRQGRVGRALIDTAVGTARTLGCDEFLAAVQRSNIPYFERSGFEFIRAAIVCGTPHGLMRARLECFPGVELGAQAAA